MFSLYKKAYYSNNSISSVYLWNLGDNNQDGLALCVLIKNSVDKETDIDNAVWDSSNVFSIKFNETTDRKGYGVIEATYKLTSTIMLHMGLNHRRCGRVAISGSLTRQVIK